MRNSGGMRKNGEKSRRFHLERSTRKGEGRRRHWRRRTSGTGGEGGIKSSDLLLLRQRRRKGGKTAKIPLKLRHTSSPSPADTASETRKNRPPLPGRAASLRLIICPCYQTSSLGVKNEKHTGIPAEKERLHTTLFPRRPTPRRELGSVIRSITKTVH